MTLISIMQEVLILERGMECCLLGSLKLQQTQVFIGFFMATYVHVKLGEDVE